MQFARQFFFNFFFFLKWQVKIAKYEARQFCVEVRKLMGLNEIFKRINSKLTKLICF